MQSTIDQKLRDPAVNNKWMWRAGAAGFVFFLVKGLAWTVAAVYVFS